MDYTTIQNAATKIVNNIKTIDGSINALQNKQDIISTSDMSMANSHNGKLKFEEIGGKCEQFSTSGNNLLENTATNQTINGGTVTVNEDKSVTITGTFTADTSIVIARLPDLPSEKLILSGCPTGGSYGTYCLQYSNFYDFAYSEYGSGVDIEKFDYAEFPNTNVSIRIVSGTTMNHTFYPMVRLASITDPTYEPYTGGIPAPNPDYPQEINKVVVSEVKTHGKNLVDFSGLTERTDSGMTFTPVYDSQGKLECINVNGTSTANVAYAAERTLIDGMSVGESYILSGCPIGANTDTYMLQFYNTDGKDTFARDYGYGKEFTFTNTLPDNWAYNVAIYIRSGYTANNLKFYPMLRKADIEDSTYEPYTESTIKLSEPIELYGIGDVKDTIEDGKVVRRFAEIVFNGVDEAWVLGEQKGFYGDILPLAGVPKQKPLSDQYFGATVTWTDGKIGISEAGVLWVGDPTCGSLEEWKSRLQANPMTVVYELATPITEPLPAVDQIALNSLSTYDTVTYLDFDSEIEPIFSGEYGVTEMGGRVLEDLMIGLNSEILAQSDADRIADLESTIVNNIQD